MLFVFGCGDAHLSSQYLGDRGTRITVKQLSFLPLSRLSESPEVLDFASKSTKKDVSVGGCSLNKPPFLMLLKGSTKFNKARTFNINSVSVEA